LPPFRPLDTELDNALAMSAGSYASDRVGILSQAYFSKELIRAVNDWQTGSVGKKKKASPDYSPDGVFGIGERSITG